MCVCQITFLMMVKTNNKMGLCTLRFCSHGGVQRGVRKEASVASEIYHPGVDNQD